MSTIMAPVDEKKEIAKKVIRQRLIAGIISKLSCKLFEADFFVVANPIDPLLPGIKFGKAPCITDRVRASFDHEVNVWQNSDSTIAASIDSGTTIYLGGIECLDKIDEIVDDLLSRIVRAPARNASDRISGRSKNARGQLGL